MIVKNSQLKTLVNSDFTLYQDKYWRALHMFMENHQNQKTTELIWEEYVFDNQYKPSDFNKATLKRVK